VRAYLTLLLSLAALWGASFMFIEIALDDLEPTTLMAGRCLIAVVFLLALMASQRRLGALRGAGWRVYALGIVNSALPFTLIAWGQQHIDSGVAAIGNSTSPIWVAVLAIWLAHSERATGLRIVGIVVGLVGVAVLAGAQPDAGTWAIVGTLAVVLAAFLYALASILIQRQSARLDPLTLSATTMVGASVVLLPFGIAQAPSTRPGWESVAAVLVLGIAGTGVGILIFMKIISDYGSFRAQLVTYLLPVTALLYGTLLLGETVTGWMVVGLLLILTGVALGSGALRPQRVRDEVAEPARP